MPRPNLLPPEETMSRLERVLADSPAELTEIAWIELRHGREGARQRRDGAEPAGPADRAQRTVVVRVWERGRTGSHRTGVGSVSELSAAVREALGQARLAPPPAYAKPAPAAAPHEPAVIPRQALFDPEIAELEAATARELLSRWTERGEAARLGWVDGQLVLAASDGRRTAVRATAVALEIGRGPDPGGSAGSAGAAGAARSLAALDGPEIAARARRRKPPAAQALQEIGPPSQPVPLLLAPEAAAVLIDLLNRALLSSTAFRDPASPLRGRLGSPLFDRAITLADDGTDGSGLPFPCDLAGARKRVVELIREGVVLTPAVDEALAVELARPATPHALSSDEFLAMNLFLRPGGRSDDDLLRELGEAGGLWVGHLGGIELYPGGLRFRARASGVRRIAGSELAEALPDLTWEDRLPDALSRVIGVGDRPLVVGAHDPLRLFLGGTSAPALAIDPRGRDAALFAARG